MHGSWRQAYCDGVCCEEMRACTEASLFVNSNMPWKRNIIILIGNSKATAAAERTEFAVGGRM